jgi:Ca-activated chloride channel family protein
MSFAAPGALLGLAIVPLAAASYVLAQRARRRYAVQFTNLDLLANVVTGTPRWRRHVPPLFFLLALAALVLAVAQPQVNDRKPRQQATVMLTIDRSGSMQATDVQPSRLKAAQASAKRFVNRLPRQFRIGLIAFNNIPQVLVPPTTDRSLLNGTIDGLQPKGGTAIGSGIDTALNALRPILKQPRAAAPSGRKGPPAVVVLQSDGYSTTGPDPLASAQQAKKLGVPINTVALGTDAATVTLTDRLGITQTVRVPPDRPTLQRIAKTTGGQFFDAQDQERLGNVYKSLGSSIGYVKVKRDVTQAFAGAGLGLMILGGVFSLFWFGRLP